MVRACLSCTFGRNPVGPPPLYVPCIFLAEFASRGPSTPFRVDRSLLSPDDDGRILFLLGPTCDPFLSPPLLLLIVR